MEGVCKGLTVASAATVIENVSLEGAEETDEVRPPQCLKHNTETHTPLYTQDVLQTSFRTLLSSFFVFVFWECFSLL